VRAKLAEATRRLARQRSIGDAAWSVLLALWIGELGLLLCPPRLAMLFAALAGLSLWAWRRRGRRPIEAEITALVLDRRADLGALIESGLGAKSSEPASQALRRRAGEALAILDLAALIPLRLPQGSQLGVALALLLALIPLGQRRQTQADARAQVSVSLLAPGGMLDGAEEGAEAPGGELGLSPVQEGGGAEPKSEAAVDEALARELERIAAALPDRPQMSEPGASSSEPPRGESPESSLAALTERLRRALEMGAEAEQRAAAAELEGRLKQQRPGLGRAALLARAAQLRSGGAGTGRGAKPAASLGTHPVPAVFQEGLARALGRRDLSWRARETLVRYFSRLVE